MRRPGEKIIDLGSKYILYNMGNDKKYGEVGFLINRKLSGIIVITVHLWPCRLSYHSHFMAI